MGLASKRHLLEGDVDAVFDHMYRAGWTDGLPVIPPTHRRVEAMIEGLGWPAEYRIGRLPPKYGEATIEKLAINAVMAGCLPEYFPVVVGSIQALLDPAYNLYSVNTTTHPATPMLMINGPIRHELDINFSWGCMGPGWRANATIGRAVNLAMLNIGGRIPGVGTKAVHAQPGRFTWCFAEWEEESPWEPYHVERGFDRNESTVTVSAPGGVRTMEFPECVTGEDVLANIAGSLHGEGGINIFPQFGQGEMPVIMCTEHAKMMMQDGFTKQKAKEYLYEHTRHIPFSSFSESKLAAMRKLRPDQFSDKGVALAARPDQFMIYVSGGPGGLHTRFCDTFGDTWIVTKRLPRKGEPPPPPAT